MVCVWEGVGDRTETAIFWPPLLWPSTLCLSRSPGLLNRRPRGPLFWVICYILSATSLHANSIGGPEPLRPGLAFLNTSRLYLRQISNWNYSWLLSWLSYIIVQRPLSRLLDFWNRMLDRHQAEITVMQFTGHSLPVYQSMSVPWEFFTSSHFISQFPPTQFPLITAIGMCHLLPVHHLGMAF